MLHVSSQEVAEDVDSGAVTEDGLEVLDELGGDGVLDIHALDSMGAVEEGAREFLLDATSVQTDSFDGLHDVLEVLLGEGGGHEGVLDGPHYGVVEAVPGVLLVDLVGSDAVSPTFSFLPQILSLVVHLSIGSSHHSKSFSGFSDFQSGNVHRSSAGAGVDVQVARDVSFLPVSPLLVLVFKVDHVPVTLLGTEGAAGFTKIAFPMIEDLLHLQHDFFASGVVVLARMSYVCIVYKHKAYQVDDFSTDRGPHVQTKTCFLHCLDDYRGDGSPTAACSCIPLEESLVWGAIGIAAVGDVGVAEGSSDVVGQLLDGVDHGLDGLLGTTKSEEAEKSNEVNDSIEASLGVVGDNGGCLPLLAEQVIGEGLSKAAFDGSMLLASAKVVRGEVVQQFGVPHDVTVQLLEVHVGICFQEEDGSEFVGSIVIGSFEEHDVGAELPAVVGEAGGVGDASSGCIEGGELWVHGVGFEDSEVEPGGAGGSAFLGSFPCLGVFRSRDVLGDWGWVGDVVGAAHRTKEVSAETVGARRWDVGAFHDGVSVGGVAVVTEVILEILRHELAVECLLVLAVVDGTEGLLDIQFGSVLGLLSVVIDYYCSVDCSDVEFALDSFGNPSLSSLFFFSEEAGSDLGREGVNELFPVEDVVLLGGLPVCFGLLQFFTEVVKGHCAGWANDVGRRFSPFPQ